METSYDKLLRAVLAENRIRLFDLKGKDLPLDYQRHVLDSSNDPAWRSTKQRQLWTIQLALDVWADWEIHIRKSSYKRAYFGGVHVEDLWIQRDGRGSSPCVLMMNQDIRIPGERLTTFPLAFQFKSQDILGPVTVYATEFRSEGRLVKAWRFYLGGNTALTGSP